MKYMNERDHNKENGWSFYTFYQSLFQKKGGLINISKLNLERRKQKE
jgi:hypothetical protein